MFFLGNGLSSVGCDPEIIATLTGAFFIVVQNLLAIPQKEANI